MSGPTGRADDFAWPRREVGHEQVKGETPMASASPDGGARAKAPTASLKPKKHRSQRWDRFRDGRGACFCAQQFVVSGLIEVEREAVPITGDAQR